MEKFLEEIFFDARINSVINYRGYQLGCHKTKHNHQCAHCYFKVMSKNCPKVGKTPACFGSVRTDRESVFYPKINLNNDNT